LVHIETGKSSPTVDTLQKLASALAVEVGDFFPKAQGALFSPDDPPVGRGADEAAAEPLRVLNECLHGMQQAYAPGRELNWSRETLEDVSALVAKTAVRVADAGLAAGGNDSFVEAVQIISRARHVMQLLDERAADAPSQATGPPPENVVELREKLRQVVPELRAG
jgi:transcriptional regulator with XRE-family HTH domain